AHLGQVVALRIEEQVAQQGAGAVHRGRIAGAQLAINLDESVAVVVDAVFGHSVDDDGLFVEQLQNVVVGIGPVGVLEGGQSANQNGGGQLTGLVATHHDLIGGVAFELQPGTAVGDDLRLVGDAVGGRVGDLFEVDAGRAHQLA